MYLDFTKLFPKACSELHISDFCVNVADIKYFKRSYRIEAGFKGKKIIEDVLQIGNSTIRFPPTDDGLIILKSIIDANNIVTEYENNKEYISSELREIVENEYRFSKQFLSDCVIKYGGQTLG